MTTHIEDDELVGLPEVARVLGVHRATVNDMVRAGRLAATRVGAHWMVRSSDLDRFASTYVRPSNAPTRRPTTLPATAPTIVALLNEFHCASAIELAPLLAVHEGNVRKHLRLMEAAGMVAQAADGQWSLVEPGTHAAGWKNSQPATRVA